MATNIARFPQDEDELWEFVTTFLGIQIPRVAVCPTHVAPFTAFADAFFARSPVMIWKASRGFGGKSFLLAALAYMEQITWGAGVSVLGGSGSQSMNVNRYIAQFWNAPRAPRELLIQGAPAQFMTELTNGAFCRVLMASQASVRGPHPQRLRMDEADEMDISIFDAAMGQPMEGRDKIPTQVVISSTHQYPNGTMTELLKRAKVNGWPVYEFCWKENVEPNGWLSLSEVQRKRSEVTETMWRTEYDLQEPAAQGRAITPEAVEQMFDAALGVGEGTLGQDLHFEDPVPWGLYTTGADWGRKVHYSAIVTFRLDCTPCRVVALWRDHRKPYAVMAPVLNRRLQKFPGKGVHDAMGVGDAVREHLTLPVEDYTDWQGKSRYALFNEYIAAIEQHKLLSPRITAWYDAHRFLSNDDLFGSGHPPDEIAACALAWHGRPAYLGVHVADVPILHGDQRRGDPMVSASARVEQREEPVLQGRANRGGLIL
jgi:hypothetical protein